MNNPMKAVKLKVIHRLFLNGLLSQAGDNRPLAELNQLLKVIDKTSFSEEESKKLNIRNEEGAWKWDSESEEDNEAEFSDEQVKLVSDIIKEKDKNKEFSIQHVAVLNDLCELFGLEL